MNSNVIIAMISAAASVCILAPGMPVEAKDANFNLPLCPVLHGTKKADPSPGSAQEPMKLPPADTATKRTTGTSLQQAQKVNLVPLALIPDKAETDSVRELSLNLEQKQLTELWGSTIDRSPDIQYVINIVQPNTDRKHVASTAGKLLNYAFSDVLRVAPAFSPAGQSVLEKVGTGIASHTLNSAFDKSNDAAARAAGISTQEKTLLFKMVRDVADRLVDGYRNYKFSLDAYDYANEGLADMQQLIVKDSGPTASDKLLDRQFLLRQNMREVKACENRVELHRHQLLDLAGSEAVERLDDQIIEGRQLLARLGAPAGRQLLIPSTKFVAK